MDQNPVAPAKHQILAGDNVQEREQAADQLSGDHVIEVRERCQGVAEEDQEKLNRIGRLRQRERERRMPRWLLVTIEVGGTGEKEADHPDRDSAPS